MRSPFPPLPGSGPPARGLFIDRWGTLLELPEQGFVTSFDEAQFFPGVLDAMFHAGQAGWTLYLLGNEFSVSSGKLPLEAWQQFERDLLEALRSHGVPIQRSYACTDDPEGTPPHTKDSVFFLPNTGALYHAAQVDGIHLDQSWVVGDSSLELVAGWRAGCHTAGVRTGMGVEDGGFPVDPEILSNDLAEVLIEVAASDHAVRP